MTAMLTTIKRRYAAKIAHMTAEQAKAALAEIKREGITIHHATIRELTGGYCSQSLNHMVVQRLAQRAGILPKVRK